MSSLKIDGLDALQGKLKKMATLNDVKDVVKINGVELESAMKKNAQFKKGYSTGTTGRSITLQLTDNGYTAQVRPTTHYAAYVEWGTRFMTAQPFVRPSYQSQKRKFIDDLKRLMK